MRKLFLLALFVCFISAWGQGPPPDCSKGFCAGIGSPLSPLIPCKAGNRYTQLDAPGTGWSCTGVPPNWVQDTGSLPISVLNYGADPTGVTDSTAALVNAVNASAATGRAVYIPAGTYSLNNSAGPILSGNKSVRIYGDGTASSLVCTTLGQDCITSTGATGFALDGLAISYGPTATTRSSGYALNVTTCTSCRFTNLTLNNGNLSGVRLASSNHVWFDKVAISNFLANGMFTINNSDLHVSNESCTNNNDACFEASYFDSQFTAFGTLCQNITVNNLTSNNDSIGILINSCQNVSVSNFAIYNSGLESVFVGQDPTTTTTTWPDRVNISNGTIYGSGYGTNFRNAATAQGLYVNTGTSSGSFISHIQFSNINVGHTSGWGFSMAELNGDDVQMSNLRFDDTGSGNTQGCVLLQGNVVNMDGVSCSRAGTYSLYVQNTNYLAANGFSSKDPNQVGAGTQAIYSATTGYVLMNGVATVDTHAGTNLSAIFDASASGVHSFINMSNTGTVTPPTPTSANANTVFFYNDPTHPFSYRGPSETLSFTNSGQAFFNTTSGATSSNNANSPVWYVQSRCWNGSSAQTESVAWVTTYPTLTTESWALTETGGCAFPIVLDLTKASVVSMTSASIPSIKATTGTRYVCVDTTGKLISSTTACSGT